MGGGGGAVAGGYHMTGQIRGVNLRVFEWISHE